MSLAKNKRPTRKQSGNTASDTKPAEPTLLLVEKELSDREEQARLALKNEMLRRLAACRANLLSVEEHAKSNLEKVKVETKATLNKIEKAKGLILAQENNPYITAEQIQSLIKSVNALAFDGVMINDQAIATFNGRPFLNSIAHDEHIMRVVNGCAADGNDITLINGRPFLGTLVRDAHTRRVINDAMAEHKVVMHDHRR